MEVSKKKARPFVIVIYVAVVGFAVFIGISFLKASRLRHEQETLRLAKEALEANYPRLSPEAMRPLFDTELVWDGYQLKKCSPSEPIAVFLFTPGPGTENDAAMMNEICSLMGLGIVSMANRGPVKHFAVLFAPSPKSIGWTLVAKLWLSRCLQNQSTKDVQNLALALVGPKPSNDNLKRIWTLVPPDLRAKAESILETNRAIAKKLEGTQCIVHDVHGVNYQIRNGALLANLLDQYYKANPDQVPKY